MSNNCTTSTLNQRPTNIHTTEYCKYIVKFVTNFIVEYIYFFNLIKNPLVTFLSAVV